MLSSSDPSFPVSRRVILVTLLLPNQPSDASDSGGTEKAASFCLGDGGSTNVAVVFGSYLPPKIPLPIGDSQIKRHKLHRHLLGTWNLFQDSIDSISHYQPFVKCYRGPSLAAWRAREILIISSNSWVAVRFSSAASSHSAVEGVIAGGLFGSKITTPRPGT